MFNKGHINYEVETQKSIHGKGAYAKKNDPCPYMLTLNHVEFYAIINLSAMKNELNYGLPILKVKRKHTCGSADVKDHLKVNCLVPKKCWLIKGIRLMY